MKAHFYCCALLDIVENRKVLLRRAHFFTLIRCAIFGNGKNIRFCLVLECAFELSIIVNYGPISRGTPCYIETRGDSRTWYHKVGIKYIQLLRPTRSSTMVGAALKGMNTVWKAPIQSKVKAFLWLVVNDASLSRENLIWRQRPIDGSCVQCQSNFRVHLFLSCQLSSNIWVVVCEDIGVEFIPSQLRDIFGVSKESRRWWDIIAVVTLWCI